MDIDGKFRMYFGAASGGQRKALKQESAEDVFISYTTEKNTFWQGLENKFMDSGGYSFFKKGMTDFQSSNEDYIAHVLEQKPKYYVLRDYPCEPDILEGLGRSVQDHQLMTLEQHRKLLDLHDDNGVQAEPVAVIQGWDTQDYLRHIDHLKEYGLLTDYVAIGTICRRNQDTRIRNIITQVRRELPSRCDIHAFGVKTNVLKYSDVVKALRSADSQAYDYGLKIRAMKNDDLSASWDKIAECYTDFRQDIRQTVQKSLNEKASTQHTLNEAF